MQDDNTQFHIARGGSTFGPYTAREVREHLATGHVLSTDIARTDAMHEWLPLPELFPEAALASRASRLGGLPRAFPNPPDLPWWVALLLALISGLTFFYFWDLVEAWWMHRVRPQSHALILYSLVFVLFCATLPATYHVALHTMFGGPAVDEPFGRTLALLAFVLRLTARFSMRRSLLEHFNGPEPVGLHLSWWMTLVFGGLYFQYHFNRVNSLKRQLRASE